MNKTILFTLATLIILSIIVVAGDVQLPPQVPDQAVTVIVDKAYDVSNIPIADAERGMNLRDIVYEIENIKNTDKYSNIDKDSYYVDVKTKTIDRYTEYKEAVKK